MDNNTENNKRKCPVCGRFAKAEAVEKHEQAMKAMRDALAECRQAISDKDVIIDTMKANLSLYETEHDKLTRKVESQKSELARREKTIGALRAELSERGTRIAEVEMENKSLAAKLSERGTRIAEVEMENKSLAAKLDVYRSRGLWARIINSKI